MLVVAIVEFLVGYMVVVKRSWAKGDCAGPGDRGLPRIVLSRRLRRRMLRRLVEMLVEGLKRLWDGRRSDKKSEKACEVKSLLDPRGGLQNDNMSLAKEGER